MFWRLKTSHPEKIVVSCPDVMFNTYSREIPDGSYEALARKWSVKKWVESNGRVRWYGCRRGHSHTSSDTCSFQAGIGVPPCDLENLADAIKFVMKECEDAGLFCELQEGTLLGKVVSPICLLFFSFKLLDVNPIQLPSLKMAKKFQLKFIKYRKKI